MHVLVTGAAGFIGSHVCEALLARGDSVVGVDNFNAFYAPERKERNVVGIARAAAFRLVRGDVNDAATLTAAFAPAPDVVVHLAAYAGVRPSVKDPAHYQRENVGGTLAVLDAVRAQPQPARVVLASSSSVYGNHAKVPFDEYDGVDAPASPYAASKRACELFASTYHQLFGLDVDCLRFFTVYGPRQRPEMAISAFAKRMLSGLPCPQHGDGRSARDYTYIDDIVAGVLLAVDKSRGFHITNLGSDEPILLRDMIDKLACALGITPHIEVMPPQPGDVERTWAALSRAHTRLGYQRTVSFDDGIRRFAQWFLQEHSESVCR